MATADLTMTVTVVQRPLWRRLARLPATFRGQYRIMRRSNGVLVSLYATWLLAGVALRFK